MPHFYLLSIEDDILNLMDEVDLDEFLKEASDAIDDADRLSDFIREKSTIAVERFLVSYSRSSPAMSFDAVLLITNVSSFTGLPTEDVHTSREARFGRRLGTHMSRRKRG